MEDKYKHSDIADFNAGKEIKKISVHQRAMLRIRAISLSTCFLVLLCIFTLQPQASDIPLRNEDKAAGISRISAKAKFSFGYDNNVLEQREGEVGSRFYQFYVSSGMHMLPFEGTLLSLKLQDGLKYLDSPSLSGESVLINGLNLRLSHKLSKRLIPEIQSEIRGRTSIHSESDVPSSEEAYLRGSLGMALKAVVYADVTGKAFCRYGFTNFEDFDPFDRRGPQIGLRADVRLLPGATMSLQYSREKARFDKWDMVSSTGKTTRVDITDDVSLYAQLYKYVLFDITYSYQNNRSDIDGYSYRANKFALLLARSLPWDFMFQLYGLARLKKYRAAPKAAAEPIPVQVNLEDDERGILTLKLSKDIDEDCALEAQYDLRRSRSYKEDGLYTRSVLSFSLSFHF